MTSQVITSTQFTIPANTSFYGNFPLNGGNLLSVGIQNFGFVNKNLSDTIDDHEQHKCFLSD
jgi:hypothetical protein